MSILDTEQHMTPRITLDKRRIQVWQAKRHIGKTIERITWFDGTRWWHVMIGFDGWAYDPRKWRRSSLIAMLTNDSYTELTSRSDA